MDIFQSAFEFSAEALLVLDGNGGIVTLNEAAARLFGCGRDELRGRPIETLFPQGLDSSRAAVHGRRVDGSLFPAEARLKTIESEAGKQVLCAVRDVTESRQTALQAAELAELHETERLAGIGSWTWDMRTGAVRWSDQLYRNVGMQPGQPATPFEEQKKFYTEEGWARLGAAVGRAVSEGAPYEIDCEMTLQAPLPRWITARGEAIFDTTGQIVGLRGTAQDITERKRLVEMLEDVQQRLRLAVDAAELGTYEWDVVTGRVIWDARTEQIFGFEPGTFDGTYHSFEISLHPDDRAKLSEAVARVRESRGAMSEELRIIRKDGGQRWILGRGAWVYDDEGKALRMHGVTLDITERKAAEAALATSEERLRQAVRAARIGIFDQDHVAGTIDWMPYQLIVTGWGAGAPVSMEDYFHHVHPEDIEGMKAKIAKAMDPAEDGLLDGLHRIVTDDGSIRWVHVQSQTFFKGPAEARWAARTVGSVRDVTAQKKNEEELRKLATVVARSPSFIGIATLGGQVLYVNDAALRLVGLKSDDAPEMSLIDFFPESDQRLALDGMFAGLKKSGSWNGEARFQNFQSDEAVEVEITAFHVLDDRGAPVSIAMVTRDLTERKRLEAERAKLESQLFQAQKMESIGRLAGGVAHDFNNMLTVILGYAALLKGTLDIAGVDGTPGSIAMRQLHEIEKAAARSRDLTQKLLGFSRRQIIAPVPSDLNQLLEDLQAPLARLIGEDIELSFYPGEELWRVVVDSSQLNQVLLNLVVNARDAMPLGGKLTIETQNTVVSEEYCRLAPGATPGAYVLLAVSDTGVGIGSDTLPYIFEPFFTTKGENQGTGLGLATVYGAVKQNGGFVTVYSEPGHGATFKIYLPRMSGEGLAEENRVKEEAVPPGRGTILLVEDNDLVREMTASALESLGYNALVAASPAEAIALCEAPGGVVSLLLTDVVMPAMNGMELRNRLRVLNPSIRVLFMSGYTSNVIVRHGVLKPGVNFIQKPFTIEELGRRIQQALESETEG